MCPSLFESAPRAGKVRRPSFESLESRLTMASDTMTGSIQPPVAITPEEQLMIELTNRARANPSAEAQRFGIDLNSGLPNGSMIDASSKQPLAPVSELQRAAVAHSTDLLMRDYFDHLADDPAPHGKTPTDRGKSAGYNSGVGENLALWPLNGFDSEASVQGSHKLLFQSSGHRQNITDSRYTHVGIGIRVGDYSGTFFGGDTHESMITTEKFGLGHNAPAAITGVAFNDNIEDNDFYNIGEGVEGLTIEAVGAGGERYRTTTGPSGGYTLRVPDGVYQVLVQSSVQQAIWLGSVNVTAQNIKLDVMTDKLTSNSGRTERHDVNKDGKVGAIDVLLIVNHLNQVPTELRAAIFQEQLDVNDDGRIEPLDAMLVINEINRENNAVRNLSAGERPADGASTVVCVDATATSHIEDSYFFDETCTKRNRK